VQLLETEIKMLCVKARDIFMQQPILLELEAPIKICGKLCHGYPVRSPCLFHAAAALNEVRMVMMALF